MKGIAKITCKSGHDHGVIMMTDTRSGLVFDIDVWGLKTGLHGFHVHSSGNLTGVPMSLCKHYNPERGNSHGKLNSIHSHKGDLGNLLFSESGVCQEKVISKRLELKEIFGRSLVIHAKEDDLGLGNYEDSRLTGHSGQMKLWGVIAVDEKCE